MDTVKSLIAEYNNITHIHGTRISNNLPIWTGGFRTPGNYLILRWSNSSQNKLVVSAEDRWLWSDGSKFGSFMDCQRSSFNGGNDNDRIAINEPTQVLTQSSNACFWTSHDVSNKYPYICQVDFRKSKIHTELNIFGIKSFLRYSPRSAVWEKSHSAEMS